MNISVGVVAVGNTSQREVAELTGELREAVERLRGVESVEPVRTAAPSGAKGIGEVLGAFLVNLPGTLIPGVLEILKAVVSRPAQPPVQIKITADTGEVTFDPKQIKAADLALLIEQLRPKGAGKSG
jgi:hypothetical protein